MSQKNTPQKGIEERLIVSDESEFEFVEGLGNDEDDDLELIQKELLDQLDQLEI